MRNLMITLMKCVQGHLLLGAAINLYNIDLISLLLEKNFNSSIKTFRKYTSLRYLGIITCGNIVKLLLECSANSNL